MSEVAPPRWRIGLSWLFAVAVLAAVVAVARQNAEERELAQIVRDAAPAWLVVVTALQAGTYLAAAAVWGLVLGRAGVARPLGDLVALALAKLFVDQAIPSGGISGTLVVVRGLVRRGVPIGIVTAGVTVDLVSWYAAYGAALAASLAVLASLGSALSRPLAVGVVLFAGVAVAVPLGAWRLARGARLPAPLARVRPLRELAETMSKADPALLDPRLVVGCVPLQLAVMTLDASTVWAALHAVGTPAPAPRVFACFLLASVARTVGVVPGGLGTFEAALVGLLHAVGVAVTPALAAALVFRGWSFFLPMAPGLLFARRETRA